MVIIAVGFIVLCGEEGLRALIAINRTADAMRTINQARAIVQRNIDSAMGVPFNKTACPPVLALTSSNGSTYDDDGNADNLEDISVGRNGSTTVRGTLTRIVTAEPNPENADIRRITFRLTYNFRLMPYTFEMTTIRAMD